MAAVCGTCYLNGPSPHRPTSRHILYRGACGLWQPAMICDTIAAVTIPQVLDGVKGCCLPGELLALMVRRTAPLPNRAVCSMRLSTGRFSVQKTPTAKSH